MKTRLMVLTTVMSILTLCGCVRKTETVPPQPHGTLAAIEYSRRVDMVWGENHSVRVAPGEIVFIEYFVEEERDYRLETGIPLEEGRWQQLEKGALEALPGLTEVRPQKETLWKRLFKKEEPFLLDGADNSKLSFDWKTADGTVSVSYHWKNDDLKMQEFLALLKQLTPNVKGA